MRKTLLDISGKIDAFTVAIYEQITTVAEAQKIPFFIVGATARDLVLHHGYGIEVGRATKDIDLAVQVASWDEFQELKQSLMQTGQFAETKMTQRLQYENTIPVDIVPFGSITEADGLISWPPDHAVRMNTLGFEDAYSNAIPVRLRAKSELDVLVASPASLAALKLLSWQQRAPENTKDAIDLILIIKKYLDIGNHERLHDEHKDLVNDDFDYVQAGARLLGRDIASALSDESMAEVHQIIEQQTVDGDKYSLVEDMSRGESAESVQENLLLLKCIKQGVLDITHKSGKLK